MAKWIGHWTQDQKVWASIPTAAHVGNARQTSHSMVPLFTQQLLVNRGTKNLHSNDSLLLQKIHWLLQKGDKNVRKNIPILGVQLHNLLNSQGYKCTFTCDVDLTVCVLVSWQLDTYLMCLCNPTLKCEQFASVSTIVILKFTTIMTFNLHLNFCFLLITGNALFVQEVST